ncbi:ATP-grasp domain-containing protein [Mycoplasmatota bacterium WC44]
MKVVVFIQTNKSGSSREAIRACERLNYYTILITNNEKQIMQRVEYEDVHKMIFLDDFSLENLQNYIKKWIQPNYELVSILSFVDGYVTLASKLRDEFTDNPSNTMAIETMESKLKTREVFKDFDFTPWFLKIKLNDENASILDYPLVIKKSSSSASRSVRKVDTKEEIPKSFYNCDDVLVEEYVKGEQYLFEVFVQNGNPNYIVKVKQELINTKNNSFVILGYSIDKDFHILKKERRIIKDIIKKLNIKNGEFHIEMKKDGDVYKLIELNPRPTGTGMNELMKAASGENYIEQVMRYYLNETYYLPRIKENAYSRFLVTEKHGEVVRVTGKQFASKITGVKSVFIKTRKGNFIRKPRHMGDRIGFIVATGDSVESARSTALKASKKIKFHIEEEE